MKKLGLSREEIKNRIDQEISALSGLIDEEAALLIIAKKIGIDLKENQQAAQYVPDYPLSELKV